MTSALPPIVIALRRIAAARAAPPAPAPAEPGMAAPDPAQLEIASAIAEVLRQATAYADFAAAARFFHDDIVALQTAPDAGAAVLFARAAIAAGDMRNGQRLVASARQAGAEELTLAPLDAALVALGGARNDSGTVAMQRRIDRGAAQPRAAARDAAILAALGAPMNATIQTFLLANPPQGGARAESGAMLALASSVERGAIGEGALLAVAAAGEAGPAALDAESLERVIRALRGLQLEDQARRVAAEAILAGAPG